MRTEWLLLLVLTACGGPTLGKNAFQDMTSSQKKQFFDCAYVYDREQQLRECLVVKNGWAREDAERGITAYQALAGQIADPNGRRHWRDSAGVQYYRP